MAVSRHLSGIVIGQNKELLSADPQMLNKRDGDPQVDRAASGKTPPPVGPRARPPRNRPSDGRASAIIQTMEMHPKRKRGVRPDPGPFGCTAASSLRVEEAILRRAPVESRQTSGRLQKRIPGPVAAIYVKNSKTDVPGRDPNPLGPVCKYHCCKKARTPAETPMRVRP